MKLYIIRFINLITGLIVFPFGIVLMLQANIGYPPWDVFHEGLSGLLNSSFGTASILVSVVILVAVTLMGEKLGIGTILNSILIGLLIDFIFSSNIIPAATGFISGLIMLFAGMIVISVGSCFYMRSAFGAGPRDNLMVVLVRKTNWPIGICRAIIEATVTLIGWIMGGPVGAGTVITAIAIGACVQVTFKAFRFDAAKVKHESLMVTYTALFGRNNADKRE